MGREKAYLKWNGTERLIERQIRILHEVGLDPGQVLLSIRPDMGYRVRAMGMARRTGVVYDAVEGRGPLGGIVAAMRRVPDRHLLVLAVDMPHVTPSFLRHLLEQVTDRCGAAPRVRGRWEALCAVYPPATLDCARAHLDPARRVPSALVEELARVGRIRPYDIAPAHRRCMASWNSPRDLAPDANPWVDG